MHIAEDSRKILGESSAALCRSGAAKIISARIHAELQRRNSGSLGFYVAANIGNIDVIAFAGTFTQCFRNICIAKAFLFKNQLNGAVHLFVKRVDHGSIHEMILAQKFAEALNARDGFAHSFNGHTAAVTPAA